MDTNQVVGYISSLESFGSVDGPGVRYVVFMQGCRMRCRYCHNPETWAMKGGDEYTPQDLFKKIIRYKNYWGEDGGLTVSGGEPLLQIDFVIELFKLAKAKGVHTALDTCGQPFTRDGEFFDKFKELMKYTDLVILDIKEMDGVKHKHLTGCENGNILDLVHYLSEINKDMWIRHVLVPGLTDDEEGLNELKKLMDGLTNVKRVEILPYHTLGLAKWEKLGIPYTLGDVLTPTKEEIKKAEKLLGIIR
ncbi:Pyruvate formate-lyase activating enzyme [Lachnospiraceae bacterium TWA4]|nr:Pyruvate formate-lyase activating enzyme [Lachnospiraceae bacterium TWA4]